MKGTGLTHGGFYGHFRSKDQLAAEAVTRALERSTKRQSHFTDLNDVVSDYLSERHRADRANGCAIAALGPEMARQGEDMRRGVTTHVRAQLDRFSQLLRGGTAASRRKCAIATLAGITGALMLARAVEDPSLSEEILTAARDAFGRRSRQARAIIGSHHRGRSLRQRLPHGLTRALPLPICGDIGSLCAAEITNRA